MVSVNVKDEIKPKFGKKAIIGWTCFLSASFGVMLFPLAFIVFLPFVIMGYWFMISRGYIPLSVLFSIYILIVAIMLGGLLRISISAVLALSNVGFIVYKKCFSYLKNSYWTALLNAVAFGIFGIGCALVFSSIVPAISLQDVLYNNIINSDSKTIQMLSEISYENAEHKDGNKLEKTDPLYKKTTLKQYAEEASAYIDLLPYHAIGTIIFSVGAGGVLFLYFSNNREYLRSVRLNRKYLIYIVAPGFAIGLLSFIDGVAPFTTTIINSAITVPTGIMFYPLAYDFALRFKRRGRMILTGILLPVCILSSLIPILFFIISLIGLSDAFLNLRKYFDVLFRE